MCEPGGARKRSAAHGGGDWRKGEDRTSGHGDARRMLGHTPHRWGGVVCRGVHVAMGWDACDAGGAGGGVGGDGWRRGAQGIGMAGVR